MMINFTGGETIKYTYSADGRKLRAAYTTVTPVTSKTVDYCGNLVFENGQLKQVLVDGGYIPMDDWSGTYRFYVKDHLGNNRMVVHQSGTIEQVNNYYPYGGLMANSTGWNTQRYKYNGKEMDRMHGLDWYDYGARWMDASIGRWHSVDPLCEKYYNVSPYVYCLGDPINQFDPDGKKVRICSTDKTQILKYINSLASGTFKVDKYGYLYQASKQTDGKHSNLYSERLVDEINSDKVNNIVIDDKLTVVEGKPDIKKFGEGATVSLDKNKENFLTVISGKSRIAKDENGNDMNQTPAEILMHEIVGHSAPNMSPSKHDTGNAIKNENKVREELNIKKREEDESHVE